MSVTKKQWWMKPSPLEPMIVQSLLTFSQDKAKRDRHVHMDAILFHKLLAELTQQAFPHLHRYPSPHDVWKSERGTEPAEGEKAPHETGTSVAQRDGDMFYMDADTVEDRCNGDTICTKTGRVVADRAMHGHGLDFRVFHDQEDRNTSCRVVDAITSRVYAVLSSIKPGGFPLSARVISTAAQIMRAWYRNHNVCTEEVARRLLNQLATAKLYIVAVELVMRHQQATQVQVLTQRVEDGYKRFSVDELARDTAIGGDLLEYARTLSPWDPVFLGNMKQSGGWLKRVNRSDVCRTVVAALQRKYDAHQARQHNFKRRMEREQHYTGSFMHVGRNSNNKGTQRHRRRKKRRLRTDLEQWMEED